MIRDEMNPAEDPHAIEDLTYAELVAMIEVICNPSTEVEILEYYLGVIDCTLPSADVSDLIYWPNHWFKDEDMLHVELSPAQMAGYLMSWTEKHHRPGTKYHHLIRTRFYSKMPRNRRSFKLFHPEAGTREALP